jgi:hypothetical protein
MHHNAIKVTVPIYRGIARGAGSYSLLPGTVASTRDR